MPTYIYICRDEKKCGYEQEVMHSILEDPKIKCEKCGGKTYRKICGGAGFILKGEGWPGKSFRTKDQMKGRRKVATKRMIENKEPMKLKPNVEGEEFSSWKEAKKVAAEKGKDAKTYDGFIEEEKKVKKKGPNYKYEEELKTM